MICSCNSDYLAPSTKEIKLKEAAGLLVHLCDKLCERVPDGVRRQAQDSYGNNTMRDDDLVVFDLCKMMTKLHDRDPDKFNGIVFDGSDKNSRRLADWWQEHQEADAIRVQNELEKKRKKALVESAISKITPEEYEALVDSVQGWA